MNRTPPPKIRRELRREVGFRCPVPGCGSPFLEWHHFDPPWSERNHHELRGMIALCTLHHPQADGGAYTVQQLHQFKANALTTSLAASEKFDWLRSRLLVYIGGNHYLETSMILRFRGKNMIYFSFDEQGHWLLNIQGFSSANQEPRLIIEDNFWIAHGNQEDLECAPSGKSIIAKYPNGDKFSVKFHEILDEAMLLKRYPQAHPRLVEVGTSITAVDITLRVAGTQLDFGPSYSRVGSMQMEGGLIKKCKCVFDI